MLDTGGFPQAGASLLLSPADGSAVLAFPGATTVWKLKPAASGTWTLAAAVNGGAYTDVFTVDSAGAITVVGNITKASALTITVSSGALNAVVNTALNVSGGNATGLTLGGILGDSTTAVNGGGIIIAHNTNYGISFNPRPLDAATVTLSLAGQAPQSSASTNITGGLITITGGAGASGSSGAANGGSVRLDGGQGFGTGTSGDVIVGNTRGRLSVNGLAITTVAKSASYTVTVNDYAVEADATSGAVVLTLPPLSTVLAGQEFRATKTDAGGNAVTFDGDGSETINGATTLSTTTQYATLRIKANAAKTAWYTV